MTYNEWLNLTYGINKPIPNQNPTAEGIINSYYQNKFDNNLYGDLYNYKNNSINTNTNNNSNNNGNNTNNNNEINTNPLLNADGSISNSGYSAIAAGMGKGVNFVVSNSLDDSTKSVYGDQNQNAVARLGNIMTGNNVNSVSSNINSNIKQFNFQTNDDIIKNTANVNYLKNIKKKSTGQSIAGVLGSGLQGFGKGMKKGGVVGGIIGAVVEGGASALGDILASKQVNSLNNQIASANSTMRNNIDNNIDRIAKNTMKNKMSTYYAYGGNLFAMGGMPMQQEMPNDVQYINEGGTHEENPNQGVQIGVDQQGTPNLVEEGEVIYNDYVYSNRLKADKNLLSFVNLSTKYANKSFADIAKDITKNSEEMIDSITERTTNENLERLKQAQEAYKAAKMPQQPQQGMEAQMMQDPRMQEQMAQEQMMQEQQMQDPSMMGMDPMAMMGGGAPMMAYGGFFNPFNNNQYAYGGYRNLGKGIPSNGSQLFGNSSLIKDNSYLIPDFWGREDVGSSRSTTSNFINTNINEFYKKALAEYEGNGRRAGLQLQREGENIYFPVDVNGKPTFAYGFEMGDGYAINKLLDEKGIDVLRDSTGKIERGLPYSVLEKFTEEQIDKQIKSTIKSFDGDFGEGAFDTLDFNLKIALIDLNRTPSVWKQFKKFKKAVYEGDYDTMMKEYERHYVDSKTGQKVPLTRRNNYLKQLITNSWNYRKYGKDNKYDPETLKYVGNDKRHVQQAPDNNVDITDSSTGNNVNATNITDIEEPSKNSNNIYSSDIFNRISDIVNQVNSNLNIGNDFKYLEKNADGNDVYISPHDNKMYTLMSDGNVVDFDGTISDIKLGNKDKNNETDPEVLARIARNKKLGSILGAAPILGSLESLRRTMQPADYSNINIAKSAYTAVPFTPINDYMSYNPFDINYYINQLNAQTAANTRAIANNSNGNHGMSNAAFLANAYNANTKLGELARQAEEYNLSQRNQVLDFNRNTHIQNAQMKSQVDQFNASNYMNTMNQYAAAKEQIDSNRANAILGNINNLYQNIGTVGNNMVNGAYRDAEIESGVLGTMNPYMQAASTYAFEYPTYNVYKNPNTNKKNRNNNNNAIV